MPEGKRFAFWMSQEVRIALENASPQLSPEFQTDVTSKTKA